MRCLLCVLVLVCCAPLAGAQTPAPAKAAARAEVPRRDLLVEMRQIEEGGGGYVVSTAPSAPLLAPQQVRVRNGERATLRIGQTMAVQWVRSARSYNSTLAVGDATASSGGGGVTQELMWLEAGQSLSVRPRWSGARQPVTLEVELQSADVDAHAGATVGSQLPVQSRAQLLTVVTVPPGAWVTVAASGARAQPGVYSSASAGAGRRLLQLRVQAP